MSVSELCIVKKPVVFVPYPYAAEDHQTANAKKLVDQQAALMISDNAALRELVPAVISLSKDASLQEKMKNNISRLGVTDADELIARNILSRLQS